MKNFEGYLKLKLGNDYVLLAGGGHKTVDDFLLKSGGTIESSDFGVFNIQRNHTTNAAAIGFKHYSTGTTVETMGYIGMQSKDGYLLRYNSDTSSLYTILDSENSSVSLSDSTLTVKINGISKSITSTTYSNFVGSGPNAASGLVPAPDTTAGTVKYLREDGTWLIPPNDDTWKAANILQEGYVPKSIANKILKSDANGDLFWGDDSTNTFYDLQFQNSSETIVDTYKPNTSPTKTLKAGSNVTISATSNVITIASTDTWNANAVGVAGYVAAPTKEANANMVWKTDLDGNPAWRALVAADIPDLSGTYVTLSGEQTFIGNKTFSGTNDFMLTINRINGNTTWVAFANNGTILGGLGITNNRNVVFSDKSSVYTIWHSGNDGVDSGLDADLLDGLNSNEFPILSRKGTAFTSGGTCDVTEVGTYYSQNSSISASLTNAPFTDDGFKLWHLATNSNNYPVQIAIGYNDRVYFRGNNSGTWKDWRRFAFTDSNITGTAANVTGTVEITHGGTGATTRLNALKALTDESVSTDAQYFLTITNSWSKGGYTSIADAKTVLAMTGATNTTPGTAGVVPAPPSDGYDTKFLGADGTWKVPDYPTKNSWNYDDCYVSSLEINNDYLRWTKNGTTNDLTIPYASKAASDSNGRSLATYKEYSETFPPNDGTLQWYTLVSYTNNYFSKSAIIEINTRRATATILINFYNTNSPYITFLGYYGYLSASKGGFTGGVRVIANGNNAIIQFQFYASTSTGSYRQLGVKVYSEDPSKWVLVDSLVADTDTYDSFLADVNAVNGCLTGGGLMPTADNTYNIGSDTFKYKNVYATTFNGALNGNANSATTAASCTGNAASATKLKTARTLWGQSFDGTANVSGDMTGVGTISASGNNTITKTSGNAIFAAVNNNGSIELLASTNRGVYDRTQSRWLIATNGTNSWLPAGNVGIGTTLPSEKLEVSGNIKATNLLITKINGVTVGNSPEFTDTTYNAGTLTLYNTGTDTENRVWSASVLKSIGNKYLPLAGGTMTGNIIMGTNNHIYGVNLTNGSMLYFDGNRTVIGSVGATSTQATHLRSKTGHLTCSTNNTASYTIWDSGNDGSDSGLDADLLDGYHASSFALASQNLIYYTIDASSLSTFNFYPVTFDSTDMELNCEIHSPNQEGSAAYNQNHIHFLLTSLGWSDTIPRFIVLSLGNYDDNEITIGAVGIGERGGVNCVWVRGGLTYRFRCNLVPTLRSYNYNSYGEIFTIGTSLSGGSNTAVSVLWINDTGYRNMMYIALDIKSTSNIYAINFYTTSDCSKKQNISLFSEHIRKFQLKDTKKWNYGVIAQEVEEMFREGEDGNMTVNYDSILSYYIGLLENKVKALEEKIRMLETKNK